MSTALVQLGTLHDAARAEQLLLHCSNSQQLELLDCVFKANIYKPQDVVKHGFDLLKRGYLGNSKYRIEEQTCVACIDVGMWSQAADLIKSLKRAFPQSNRVKRLEGLLSEATPASGEKYSQARKIYADILKADEANLLARKREIAMYRCPPTIHRHAARFNVTCAQRLKQDGKISQAIAAMNTEILQHFSADESSWEELAELYAPLLRMPAHKLWFTSFVQICDDWSLQKRGVLHGRGFHGEAVLSHALHQAGRVSHPRPFSRQFHPSFCGLTLLQSVLLCW